MDKSTSRTGKTAEPIIATRVFDAPRERLFRALSEPELLAQWWGPKGFTNSFREFDFRPGGSWRFTMHGPDGTGYEMEHVFTEISAPERIVFKHLQAGHDFQMIMVLSEEDAERTRLTWTMQFESAEEAEQVRPFVVEANEQNFDRLAALLSDS